jgi:hypothetical protein
MTRTFRILLLCVAGPALAQPPTPTAYEALRVFGQKKGDATLNRTVELRARNGVPQPQVWKVSASDPTARGGIIEADIQKGRIIAERTPTARGPIANIPLDLNRLNLDSDGAFTVADQAMEARNIPFDRIDYTLRSPAQGSAPVWYLDLLHRGTKVATLQIAADTGNILDQQLLLPGGIAGDTQSDSDFLDESQRGGRQRGREQPPRRTASSDPADPAWSQPGEPFRGVGDFFHRLGKRFERRGHQLKNFFAGDEE